MKRILTTGLAVLAGLFLVLSAVDRSDYGIEKRLWHLQKKFARLARDPAVVPAREFESLARQYQRIIRENPQASLGGQILLQQGKVYTLKKDFVKARDSFRAVLERYPENSSLSAEALFNVGVTYEREGNAGEALRIYQTIQEKYPLTGVGLNIPLYVANYYLRSHQPEASRAAFGAAIDFYQDVYGKNPQNPAGYAALRQLAAIYLARQEWGKGVEVLGKLLVDYPVPVHPDQSQEVLLVRTINMVAINRLGDFDTPARIYRDFIDRYPGHPFSRRLDQVIREIGSLKEKSRQAQDNENP